MLNSKEGFDATVSMSIEMFPIAAVDYKGMFESLSFFTDAQKAEIRTKIHDYDLNPKSRSGGSALKKEIEKVAYFKNGLLEHIEAIREILQPREKVGRVSVREAEALAEQRSINSTAESYRKACPYEKMLRIFAVNMIGDVQGDYTKDELPVVIATKQITGVLQSIS